MPKREFGWTSTSPGRHRARDGGLHIGQPSEVFFSLFPACKRRGSFLHGAWARELSLGARQTHYALSGLVSCSAPLDLVTLTGPLMSLDAGIQAILDAPAAGIRAEIDYMRSALTVTPPGWVRDLPEHTSVRRDLGRSLAGLYDTAIARHWPRMRVHLDARAVAYARAIAKGGVHAFLQSLHPELRWSPPILTVSRHGGYHQMQG